MVNYSLEHKNLYIEFMCSELDHHVANEIREEIDNLLSVNQVKNVVFNFENINFMYSSY